MKPFIVMQTDFTKGIATNTMDGVIVSVDPELRTFDNMHDIQAFDVYEASFVLFYVVDFWPRGTIFISVVDPGVGTARRACVAKLNNGSYVVTPDNGTLTHLKKSVGISEVREIDESKHRLESTRNVSIFHGRDLFAYCAAKLASGIISFEEVGPEYPVDEIIVEETLEVEVSDGAIHGMLETADRHFGLICTNIPYKTFEDEGISHGDMVETLITHNGEEAWRDTIAYQPSFGFVDPGKSLVMISETQQMQIAKNLGNLSLEYDLGVGPEWAISFRKVEG